ncbi:MAG: hypothetical protein MUE37_08135 [Bacteroidales bacterium]|jgi:DNA-binding CsgD family transcriptional regulator|nr:hypothetical protein [Bacteroidales bacterium]
MPKVLPILLFLCSTVTFAQENYRGIPFVRNFHKSEYKADTQNWGIAEDRRGFIHFANNDGLLSFDGVEWNLARISATAPLRSVLVDSQDNIYVGLINDFGLVSRSGNNPPAFISLKYLLPEKYSEFDEIWRIHETTTGIIFQCYEYIFLYSGDTIKVIEPAGRFRFSHKVGGRILVQEPGKGVSELIGDSVVSLPWWDLYRDKEINSILELENGKLLIGTTYDGLYVLDEEGISGWKTPVNELLLKSRLYSAVRLPDNRFAFGTILNGLIISDGDGNIVCNLNTEWGIQNNTVLSLLADRTGNLWLGLDNGIDFAEIDSPLSYIGSDKIGTGYCCRVFQGDLYLGTNQGLYVVPFDSRFEENEFRLVENSAGQVWTLEEAFGQLLCGHNHGTFIIDGERAVKICNEEGAWKFIPVKGRPDLLIGGHYEGLVLYKRTGDTWSFRTKIEGFEESSRYLFQDVEGYIWVGHSGRGIFRLKMDDTYERVTEVLRFPLNGDLPSQAGNILFSFNNRIYVSAPDGVREYDETDNIFRPSAELNEIFAGCGRIMSVADAPNGYTWFIAEKESGYLRQNEDMTYTRVTVPLRKLRDRYVNEFESVYPYDSENILMGLEEGFVSYNPSVPKQYNTGFPAFITRVRTEKPDSVIYLWNGGHEAGFQFPWKTNSLRFYFASPFFENDNDLMFSYFLDGFSEEWSDWTTEHYRDFTNLREGEYALNVKARNVFGTESETAQFHFIVRPPFRRSVAAYIGYLLVIALLLYSVARYSIRRAALAASMKEEKLRAEMKEQQHIHQQESLLAEKKILDLTNEKLRSEMLFRDKELANQTMIIIEKNKFLQKVNEELYGIQDFVVNDQIRTKVLELKKKINREIDIKLQNKIFESYFDEANEDFFRVLKEKHPDLTPYDLRICAFIRMNIPTKEIAAILNISYRGAEVSRYRLRKKMQLPRRINLSAYLTGF